MNFANFMANFSKIEEKLNLPQDFISKLIHEDDWSFVIKAQGMIEAFITHLISLHTQKNLHSFNTLINLIFLEELVN